ncbi:MAG: aminopeptidase [Candidatus Pacearchaeota archaeon]|nr:aminopeptidase [Candidatus Pacearchaeota archaeon]
MEKKLANMLIENSLELTSADVLVIDYQNHTNKLFETIKKIAHERDIEIREFARPSFPDLISLQGLDKMIDGATAYLKLGGGEYKNSLKSEAIAIQRKEGEIMNKRCELKWTLTPYPSEYMSSLLNIPMKNLRKIYFDCCFINYTDQKRIQETLASQFEPGEISIKSQDTNLKFNIVENPHYCNGKINVPDGEVFWEINPYRTEGQIKFNIPFIYGSARFKEMFFVFKDGKVIDYDSNQRDKLKELLETDYEAPYLGEFGIGTNSKAKLIGHSFIDEKVKGTFHLALGAMSLGLESRLHMDMVKSLKDCEIRNNGKKILF